VSELGETVATAGLLDTKSTRCISLDELTTAVSWLLFPGAKDSAVGEREHDESPEVMAEAAEQAAPFVLTTL
jgi:hypothetical protein